MFISWLDFLLFVFFDSFSLSYFFFLFFIILFTFLFFVSVMISFLFCLKVRQGWIQVLVFMSFSALFLSSLGFILHTKPTGDLNLDCLDKDLSWSVSSLMLRKITDLSQVLMRDLQSSGLSPCLFQSLLGFGLGLTEIL